MLDSLDDKKTMKADVTMQHASTSQFNMPENKDAMVTVFPARYRKAQSSIAQGESRFAGKAIATGLKTKYSCKTI